MYKRLLQIRPARFEWSAVPVFGRYFVQCVATGKSMQVASALAYTTLLSLVPLAAVAFGFLDALPGFSRFEEIIREFVFDNFVPAFGETVDEYLSRFTGKATQLTLTGVLALIVIALMLMATIENAFNHIWRVSELRRPVTRFLIYWLLLTLGPILIGIGLASTSYFLSLPALDSLSGWFQLRKWLLPVIPFLSTAIALTLLYILIPNCHVPARNAVIGGISAAVLFESAKFGFGYYVKTVPTYQVIYGALAVLPVFLVWLYVSWVVVLLGAQLTYSLSTFRPGDRAAEPERDWDLIDVCLLLAHLWQAQREGIGLTLEQLGALEPDLPVEHIIRILETLQTDNWIWQKYEEEGQWILTRDLSEQTLLDLHHLMPSKLPEVHASRIPRSDIERALQQVFNRYRESVSETLSVPIKPLLAGADREQAAPNAITDAGS